MSFCLCLFDSAIYYGLPLVPAYMGLSEEQKNNISTGINYASASCGILPDTGKLMVSLNILQKDLCDFGFEKFYLGFIWFFVWTGEMSLVECPSRSIQGDHRKEFEEEVQETIRAP